MDMKIALSVLALFFCGFCSSRPAMASSLCGAVTGNLVTNCGFETQSFIGWTISGHTANRGGNYYDVDASDAKSGNFGAYVSQDFIDGGTPPVDLSQTFATTAGDMYSFTFWLKQDSAPTVGYTHAFTALWGGTTVLDLTPTPALPGTVGSFTEYSFTETATGPTTVMQFDFENDDNYWSFDDVSVSNDASVPVPTTTPEPSTLILLATGLLGLTAIARRRFAGCLTSRF
jgi:hypothetical protein